MFEDLKKNLKQEKKIIADIRAVEVGLQGEGKDKKIYRDSLHSLLYQLRLLNRAVPELLKEWSSVKSKKETKSSKKKKSSKKEVKEDEKKVVRMSYVSPATKEKRYVTINKEDKKLFLEKLRLTESSLTGLDHGFGKAVETLVSKPNPFAGFSNKFFRKYSEKIAPQLDDISSDLKKGNVRFLVTTYISMALMSATIAFLSGVLIYVVLLAFSLSNFIHAWIPFVLTFFVLVGFYFYPASEASSVQKKISQELPFATIHMAAIAGSNIEPSKIFKIIAMSGEYPNIGIEIRKMITQIDIYGYDMVTALKNVSKKVSNKRLAELFSGIATNISTGGGLKNFLEKKAENYLLDYRLERQKYTELAGTFMDVYISILIAAPLVLMMMFIVMNVAGLGLGGLSLNILLMLSVFGIVVVNVLFLVVLNMKQPKV